MLSCCNAALILIVVLFSTPTTAGLTLSVTADCHCPNDGLTKATACLRKCLLRCHAGGGGCQLHFPEGAYLTGSLNLTSNMVVQLDAGAVLLGSLDAEDYPLVPALPGYGITRDTLAKGEPAGLCSLVVGGGVRVCVCVCVCIFFFLCVWGSVEVRMLEVPPPVISLSQAHTRAAHAPPPPPQLQTTYSCGIRH
jgi:hypothetical protein